MRLLFMYYKKKKKRRCKKFMFNYIFALNMYLKQRKHKKSLVSKKYIEGTVQLITTTQ